VGNGFVGGGTVRNDPVRGGPVGDGPVAEALALLLLFFSDQRLELGHCG
jgi:hypothetical protein